VNLVPELRHIIGEQPPVTEVPPQDAQRRFHLVFRRFISVFARPDHPLALFLDDLQWLDAATLDLLEDLLIQPDVQYLLLIGAYRDNEVDPSHPLVCKLEAIRRAGGTVHEISLHPLAPRDLVQLVADSLRYEPEQVASLAHLIHEKTAGNPFFAIQFLLTLSDEGLLAFNHNEGRWCWDLSRIYAKSYTDNVVDLMVAKLSRLPIETQNALQQLACLGDNADFTLLRMVSHSSEEERPILGSCSHGLSFPLGRHLQISPRPCAGSSLFSDPGTVAARSLPPHWEVVRCSDASGQAGRKNLCDREPAQPRRAARHLRSRAAPNRRVEPDRRAARTGELCLQIGPGVSGSGRGLALRGVVGAARWPQVLSGSAPGGV
jgi:hypothetical protein